MNKFTIALSFILIAQGAYATHMTPEEAAPGCEAVIEHNAGVAAKALTSGLSLDDTTLWFVDTSTTLQISQKSIVAGKELIKAVFSGENITSAKDNAVAACIHDRTQ